MRGRCGKVNKKKQEERVSNRFCSFFDTLSSCGKIYFAAYACLKKLFVPIRKPLMCFLSCSIWYLLSNEFYWRADRKPSG